MKKILPLILILTLLLTLTQACFATTVPSNGFSATNVFIENSNLIVEGWFYNVGASNISAISDLDIKVYDKNGKLVAEDIFNDSGLKSISLNTAMSKKWKFTFTGNFNSFDLSKWKVDSKFEFAYGSETTLPKGLKVYYDGTRIVFKDTQPVVDKGRTLVPLRELFEKMGANVNWEASKQLITVNRNGVEVKLQLSSDKAYINGKLITLDVPAKSINGRTVVPLRFISEAMGCQVSWGNEEQIISIYE